jgi:hypothetical protein
VLGNSTTKIYLGKGVSLFPFQKLTYMHVQKIEQHMSLILVFVVVSETGGTINLCSVGDTILDSLQMVDHMDPNEELRHKGYTGSGFRPSLV